MLPWTESQLTGHLVHSSCHWLTLCGLTSRKSHHRGLGLGGDWDWARFNVPPNTL